MDARETTASLLAGGAATAVTTWFTADTLTAILTGAGTAAILSAVLSYRTNQERIGIERRQAEVQKHEILIQSYQLALKNSGDRYDRLSDEVSQLRTDLADRIDRHLKAVEELSEARLELKTLQWEITRRDQMVADATDLVGSLKEENTRLRDRVRELEAKLRATEAELEIHKAAVQDLTTKLREAAGEREIEVIGISND